MSRAPRRIEVVIDEFVLHGFDPRHRDAIAEATRSELAAALDGWSVTAGVSVAQLEGGSFSIPAAAPPVAVGRGVARQIRQALQAGNQQAGTPDGRT